jgi:methyl-accepting chemotaxis protein
MDEQNTFASVYASGDRLFQRLMIVQAIGLVAISLWLTPKTWSGTQSSVHAHVWMSAVMGLLITVFPAMMAAARPGQLATRLIMAVCQGLVSGLLVHIGGGRVEMHFHIFVSLAFLSMYMDFKVLQAMTVVVAVDHVARGLLWPQSIYGISEAGILRTLEHASWVIAADVVLFFSISRARRERTQLMKAVMSISDCVQMITGRQADSGNEAEAIEGGLDTIRAAMLRVQDSVVSVQNQSQTLASRANQTVSAVDGGVQSAEMGQSAIDSLRDSVEEIAIVVAEINSVAEQTRLLSLNATIEAARASQSGNGFGVVARNVKELAVKSGTAASRISKLTQRCVTKVGESSRCTSDIRHQLTEIRDIVRSTDGVISEIHSSVTTSASEAEQLATAFGGRRNSRRLESVSGRFGT